MKNPTLQDVLSRRQQIKTQIASLNEEDSTSCFILGDTWCATSPNSGSATSSSYGSPRTKRI
jgi:hypothetical protein